MNVAALRRWQVISDAVRHFGCTDSEWHWRDRIPPRMKEWLCFVHHITLQRLMKLMVQYSNYPMREAVNAFEQDSKYEIALYGLDFTRLDDEIMGIHFQMNRIVNNTPHAMSRIADLSFGYIRRARTADDNLQDFWRMSRNNVDNGQNL